MYIYSKIRLEVLSQEDEELSHTSHKDNVKRQYIKSKYMATTSKDLDHFSLRL